jgi:hypothetical protein
MRANLTITTRGYSVNPEGQAAWDGADIHGRTSTPGTYLARLETGRRFTARKIVLIR